VRREIELLFHIVKNARRFEALQLSTMPHLERAIALSGCGLAISARLMHHWDASAQIYRRNCFSSQTNGKERTSC